MCIPSVPLAKLTDCGTMYLPKWWDWPQEPVGGEISQETNQALSRSGEGWQTKNNWLS